MSHGFLVASLLGMCALLFNHRAERLHGSPVQYSFFRLRPSHPPMTPEEVVEEEQLGCDRQVIFLPDYVGWGLFLDVLFLAGSHFMLLLQEICSTSSGASCMSCRVTCVISSLSTILWPLWLATKSTCLLHCSLSRMRFCTTWGTIFHPSNAHTSYRSLPLFSYHQGQLYADVADSLPIPPRIEMHETEITSDGAYVPLPSIRRTPSVTSHWSRRSGGGSFRKRFGYNVDDDDQATAVVMMHQMPGDESGGNTEDDDANYYNSNSRSGSLPSSLPQKFADAMARNSRIRGQDSSQPDDDDDDEQGLLHHQTGRIVNGNTSSSGDDSARRTKRRKKKPTKQLSSASSTLSSNRRPGMLLPASSINATRHPLPSDSEEYVEIK